MRGGSGHLLSAVTAARSQSIDPPMEKTTSTYVTATLQLSGPTSARAMERPPRTSQ